MTTIAINKQHICALDMRAICAIEDEVMPLPQLLFALENEGWKFSDIVTTAHILLHNAGYDFDYMQLGDDLMQSGTQQLRDDLTSALRMIIQ